MPENKRSTQLQTKDAPKCPRSLGRPVIFSDAVMRAICDRLAEGQMLKDICRAPGMPSERAVRQRVVDDEVFHARYQRAKEQSNEVMEDEIREISDDSSGDMTIDEKGRPVVDHENINRSRLRVDARKWILAKRNPARWGDSQRITGILEVAQQRPDLSKLSPQELEAFEALMAKAVIPT